PGGSAATRTRAAPGPRPAGRARRPQHRGPPGLLVRPRRARPASCVLACLQASRANARPGPAAGPCALAARAGPRERRTVPDDERAVAHERVGLAARQVVGPHPGPGVDRDRADPRLETTTGVEHDLSVAPERVTGDVGVPPLFPRREVDRPDLAPLLR